ncbi:MAG: hypothetical protein Q7P63_15120 [Verrucomicrobiota bacterium JB022]|nr:hypothetical protein [Verrucomicrobiota bacterium JB022]
MNGTGWLTGVISGFALLALSVAVVQSERLRAAHVEQAALVERENQALHLQTQLQEALNQSRREQERQTRQLASSEADLIEAKTRQAALTGDVARLQRELETAHASLKQRETDLADRELRLVRLRSELDLRAAAPLPAPAPAPVIQATPAPVTLPECTVLARSANGKIIALANPQERYFSVDNTYLLQLPDGRALRFHTTRLAPDAALGWIEPQELSYALDPGLKLTLNPHP